MLPIKNAAGYYLFCSNSTSTLNALISGFTSGVVRTLVSDKFDRLTLYVIGVISAYFISHNLFHAYSMEIYDIAKIEAINLCIFYVVGLVWNVFAETFPPLKTLERMEGNQAPT